MSFEESNVLGTLGHQCGSALYLLTRCLSTTLSLRQTRFVVWGGDYTVKNSITLLGYVALNVYI